MKKVNILTIAIVSILIINSASFAESDSFVNSAGMKLVRIEPGTFMMGSGSEGELDERPRHKVNITQPFYMAVTEVTNAQYEMFDPSHKQLRGESGLSKDDDEAVLHVNWHEAVNFCKWLSQKEGREYRLPTEAEWEYACRTGTTTKYYTGNTLPEEYHNNPVTSNKPKPVPLFVAKTPPNKWGLYDMHGNVEEWCLDWYGPYKSCEQDDPVGYIDGDFKVSRGGSHSTILFYLRSANRSGALPEDRNWVTGFRVVAGKMPKTSPLPLLPTPKFLRSIKQNVPTNVAIGPDPDKPYFRGPLKYVTIPENSNGPLFSKHNHCPAVTQCRNGDLLAIWYSTVQEKDRLMTIGASRLRYRAKQWDPAYLFWDIPDRNDHASSMWTDENGKIYHFNGAAATCGWGTLSVIMRTSTDNGATWSKARIILPKYETGHQPIESTFRTSKGDIILPSDIRGGTCLWFSKDNGETWSNPGGKIAGIHAGVAELSDGTLMAFGRGGNINGKMPISFSSDNGKTWQFKASEFQPLGGGQRLVLTKLKNGSLFFASFAKRLPITDSSGKVRKVNGLFGALSFDDGKTWSHKRLITDDMPAHDIGTMDNHLITLSPFNAEPVGYMSVCETADGLIQL
ncbi:MAG: SUMF1/EgtB/PvdO family nonheme iron enzyme, partial [Planctomycetota bacterium]